ncbi:hypothetical protein AQUCO_01000236v1 [Aquilegia coerulea]|uniref:Uncharacterized protein n=1 Tax=Aquilegia coerulea TaxID=218851 RepID=A0A2G5E8X0_AQUCA|nr:hypothetical protein AQUCO_01000236v1 [Aquilegia coerulea]
MATDISYASTNFVEKVQATAGAASSSTVTLDLDSNQHDEKVLGAKTNMLACPICYNTLIQEGVPGLTVESKPRPSFECSTCKKSYYSNEIYLDLTVVSGAKEYIESSPASTTIFRYGNSSLRIFMIPSCFMKNISSKFGRMISWSLRSKFEQAEILIYLTFLVSFLLDE